MASNSVLARTIIADLEVLHLCVRHTLKAMDAGIFIAKIALEELPVWEIMLQ